MAERTDFHVRADKQKMDKAKELSGLSNREIFELGCQIAIEQNQNILDTEILELNELTERVNELTDSIKSRLKDKEVPTRPSMGTDDEEELKRNIIPFDLFKEIVEYYMKDFNITDINDLNSKHKEIFQFVLINIAHYQMSLEDLNNLYNSE